MPVVKSLFEESRDQHGFYVPQFEIKIVGAGLPRNVLRDVIDVTYRDKIDEIDSCELTVNNWDSSLNTFKYIGAEQGTETGPDGRWKLFEPCNKQVELRLGYQGQLERMMLGNFTTMEPNFSASGPPTLQVRMLNELHKLRSKKYDGEWPSKSDPRHERKSDSEIAESIATLRDRDLDNAKRFPLPIFTDSKAKKAEEKLVYVSQKNEYDIDFLWKRAHLHGYVVLLLEEGDGKPRRIYFGPPLDATGQATYKLEWGKSLIDFKPTLTTANQYRSVTVRGWDRAAQKPIEEKVDFTHPKLAKLNKNLQELVVQCDPREELVIEKPVYTKKQAKDLACDLLLGQARKMVRATGTTVGLPRLRAGSKVEIGNVGSRLSGTYFVTATTHTINGSGYITRFEARREDIESGLMK